MTRGELITVIYHFGLGDIKPYDEGLSVCDIIPDIYHSEIRVYFSEWCEYSGSKTYPVPHQYEKPGLAFHMLDLWEGEYGAARRRFCVFLANELLRDKFDWAELQ